jgi:uncharacterized protein YkwD
MRMDIRLADARPLPVAAVRRLPPASKGALATACVCLLTALLAACGGSSGGTVTGSSTSQTGGSSTQPTSPAPGTPPPPTGTYNLGGTPQAVIDLCMSDADKEMLTQVNDARALARDCGTVTYPATAALSWHCTLESVAFAHSRDMGDYNFFSHTGSDGLTVADRVSNTGYDWSAVGENIAAGQPSVDSVMASWLGSPGHCANIMRATYTEFGAASYTVTGSDYPIYWTQVFARPR